MTWVKVDDTFPEHPKVVGLTDAALACWVRGLCYSSRLLTDGWIPKAALRSIGTPKAARELVAAGLWAAEDDGWRIHDYHDHQRSRTNVYAERDAARERARRSREERAARAAASQRDNSEVTAHVRPRHSDVTEPESESEVDLCKSVVSPTVRGSPHDDGQLHLDVAKARAARLGKPNPGRRYLDAIARNLPPGEARRLHNAGYTTEAIDVLLDVDPPAPDPPPGPPSWTPAVVPDAITLDASADQARTARKRLRRDEAS